MSAAGDLDSHAHPRFLANSICLSFVEASAVNLGQTTAHWWKRIALTLGIVFVVTCSSLLWLCPDPPEPIVYITRTGKKYHTYDCEFLERYNVKDKFAIVLDKAEEDYGPCGVCNPP